MKIEYPDPNENAYYQSEEKSENFIATIFNYWMIDLNGFSLIQNFITGEEEIPLEYVWPLLKVLSVYFEKGTKSEKENDKNDISKKLKDRILTIDL